MSVYSPSRAIAYKEQSILTATPGQLVVMLYDGCLRFLFQAGHAMREGQHVEADKRLTRAEAIIDEMVDKVAELMGELRESWAQVAATA